MVPDHYASCSLWNWLIKESLNLSSYEARRNECQPKKKGWFIRLFNVAKVPALVVAAVHTESFKGFAPVRFQCWIIEIRINKLLFSRLRSFLLTSLHQSLRDFLKGYLHRDRCKHRAMWVANSYGPQLSSPSNSRMLVNLTIYMGERATERLMEIDLKTVLFRLLNNKLDRFIIDKEILDIIACLPSLEVSFL